jgi:hypothetical protein
MEISVSDRLKVSAQLIMTGRGCIIGQSGSGKSYLLGVIAEELLRLNLPFCIIDTEGEYAALKSSFQLLIIGGPDQDLPIETDFEKLFYRSASENIPVVLDLSECIDKAEAAYSALRSLYTVEEKLRKPYLVMIEEADKFAPQVVRPTINVVEEISVRGRKRGIGLMVATQRPSNISKNVLSQCSYGFIGKLTIENDLSAISQLFSSRSTLDAIVNLGTGEFVPFGMGTSEVVSVRQTGNRRVGSTPLVSIQSRAESKNEINALISEFKRFQSPKKQQRKSQSAKDTQIEIESLILRFKNEQMEAYAKKVSKKLFGVFGRSIESIEGLNLKYLPLTMCSIRIPTGKHDFNEYVMLLDKDLNVVQLSNKVNQISTGIKNLKLTKLESEILDYARASNYIMMSDLETEGISKHQAIVKSSRALEEKGLVKLKGNRIYALRFMQMLSKSRPETEITKAFENQITESSKTPGEIKSLVSLMYPNASITESSEIFLPFYEITLKNKNHVRIFRLDGMFGKEIMVAE